MEKRVSENQLGVLGQRTYRHNSAAEEALGASVHVVDGNNMVAGLQQMNDGSRRGHARSVGQACVKNQRVPLVRVWCGAVQMAWLPDTFKQYAPCLAPSAAAHACSNAARVGLLVREYS